MVNDIYKLWDFSKAKMLIGPKQTTTHIFLNDIAYWQMLFHNSIDLVGHSSMAMALTPNLTSYIYRPDLISILCILTLIYFKENTFKLS